MPPLPTRPYILNELTWNTVRDARYEVAVLPWGAAEAHNFHLPYSTDNVETERIAALAAGHATARGARVVVLPLVPFGVNTGQLDIPLCVNLNPSTQALVLRDVATGLAGQGIPKLVILNGHGGNDFRQMIRELQPAVSLFLCTVNWYQVVDPKLFFEDLGDHAGELETSVMLHLAPELVRPLSEAGPGRARRFTITALREGWAWAPRRWRQVTDGATACPTYMSRAAAITALRAGTNGWTCMPTNPANEGNEPMCVDEQWMAFMQALETKATPHVKRVRVGYMIAPGGAPGSNTDPFAKAATPTNEWGYDPPHVMLLATDLNELEGIPTKSAEWQDVGHVGWHNLRSPDGPARLSDELRGSHRAATLRRAFPRTAFPERGAAVSVLQGRGGGATAPGQ